MFNLNCFKKQKETTAVARNRIRLSVNTVQEVRFNVDFQDDLAAKLKVDSLTFLGEGSFGEVFSAVRHKHGELREKVVKVVRSYDDSEEHCKILKEQTLKEYNCIRYFGKCNSSVIKVHKLLYLGSCSKHELNPYYGIVMEKCESDLDDYVAEFPIKSQEVLENLFKQIGSALLAMHLEGVVHHDVKPMNIMIKSMTNMDPRNFQYKLIDFGLAKQYPGSLSGKETFFCGTPVYMAKTSGKSYDPFKADVYALGLTLIHSCVGEQADREDVLMSAHKQFAKYRDELKLFHWMSKPMQDLLLDMTATREWKRINMRKAMKYFA